MRYNKNKRTIGYEEKSMIYSFRVLTGFSLLNTAILVVYGGAGGMIPVWIVITVAAAILSFRKCYEYFLSKWWVKIPFILGVLCFVFVEGAIIWHGFTAVPKESSDYIIILGAQVRGNKPSATLAYRLEKGYEYLEAYPKTKAVLSGGQGPDEIMTEAKAMYVYLVNKGISTERLILEDESHSTYENLTNSFKLIDAEKENATISVVSNRFHILRAQIQAKKLGRAVGGIGARSYVYLIPNYYFREFFAVMKELAF